LKIIKAIKNTNLERKILIIPHFKGALFTSIIFIKLVSVLCVFQLFGSTNNWQLNYANSSNVAFSNLG
jgi:hypothetical protein